MKYSTPLALALVLVPILLAGSGDKNTIEVHGNDQITIITLSGPAGAPFTASFVESGRSTNVSATLPWKHIGSEMKEFEFKKKNPGDVFWFEVHHTGYCSLEQKGGISAGGLGARLTIDYYGLNTQFIRMTPNNLGR